MIVRPDLQTPLRPLAPIAIAAVMLSDRISGRRRKGQIQPAADDIDAFANEALAWPNKSSYGAQARPGQPSKADMRSQHRTSGPA